MMTRHPNAHLTTPATKPAHPIARIPRGFSIPAAASGNRWIPSLVWAVPLLVVLIVASVAGRALWQRGPTVTIAFATAEGLEAHKTTIRYKSVVIGVIKGIELMDDRSGVVVTADLSRQMTAMLVDDARFWVVRPRVSAGGISGMGTLLSGAHVAFDAGASTASRRDFVGLEAAPSTISDRRGQRFTLRASNIGSLDVGSPIYLRRFQVGQVTALALDATGDAVTMEVFVDAPYDGHVTANTRFWNASGVDISLDTRGLRLDTQSLASVLLGGIAFETPPDGGGAAVPVETGFRLYASREEALRPPTTTSNTFLLTFKRSVRGLAPGAAVELLGLEVGEVLTVDVEFEPLTTQARTIVAVNLHPRRIRLRSPAAPMQEGASPADAEGARTLLRGLVDRGLRAQIRTSNVLTGQRYVSLDIVAGARPITVDWTGRPATLPTSEGKAEGVDGLIESMTRLSAKMETIPLGELAREGTLAVREMRRTFEQTSGLIDKINVDLAPRMAGLMGQTARTLGSVERTLASDAPLQRDLRAALRDLGGAGHALRVFAEYLERHPESLIRGKKGDGK